MVRKPFLMNKKVLLIALTNKISCFKQHVVLCRTLISHHARLLYGKATLNILGFITVI